jgi:hypothetical protein
VLDQAGTDVTGGTGLATTGDNDADNTWPVNALSAGTYRFFVTVTDGEGRETVSSTTVLVGDVLTVNLVPDTPIVGPGVPVRFRALANGGVAPYNFTFAAFDGEGDDDAGDRLSAVTTAGNAGIVTYVSSATAAGGYRMRVSVSDALGNTAAGVASLFVTHDADLMTSARILNPPAAQLNLGAAAGIFEPGETFNAIGNIPDDVAHFSPTTLDPSIEFARNLTILITDDDGAGLAVASISFIGVNQRGEVVTDSINNPAIGTTITTLTAPFKRLDRVSSTQLLRMRYSAIRRTARILRRFSRSFRTGSRFASRRRFRTEPMITSFNFYR